MSRKLKDLRSEDFKMLIIEDLGMEYQKESSLKKERMCIYKCNKCKANKKTTVSNAKKNTSGFCSECGTSRFKNIHGHGATRLCSIWHGMKSRTENKKNKRYENYGGKGVSICQEWKSDFVCFYAWAIENGYSDSLTIDRMDSNGNYEPNNCRWATATEQARNKSSLYRNNRSGFKGVSGKNKKWQASISIGGESTYIGVFETKKEASEAYDNYVIRNGLSHKKSADTK